MEGPVEAARAECTAKIAALTQSLDQTMWWASFFLILGAVVAATGSSVAGFVDKSTLRKVAAVCGSIGAVVSVIPSVLPNAAQLREKLEATDRHRTVGEKVFAQLSYFNDPLNQIELSKYSVARFKDCASLSPPEEVPALPKSAAYGSEAPPATSPPPK